MKILHLGDLHLGKALSEYSLIEDQKYILDQILDIISEKRVDAVLIAGDVYDRSLPSEAADSESRLEYGSRLFSGKNIHIASMFSGELARRTAQDDFGEVNIYMLPFVKASQVRHYYPDSRIESYEEAVKTVIEHADIDWSERNILIAHQFVFDYVALGHLHSPQSVGCSYIRYSGSLLKYSLSEAFSEKSVPVIELREKGETVVELVPLRPLRDLRHITGKLDQLLRSENISDPEDYMYVTLTDEEIINDVMGIVRQYYPNTVKVDYQNSHTLEIENFDIGEIVSDKTFTEIIADFYLKMYGREISEDEMEVMISVAGEAGVINEAGQA